MNVSFRKQPVFKCLRVLLVLMVTLIVPSACWTLVWSDEFDSPTKAKLNHNWDHVIGDGSIFGMPGWGFNELQYYTNNEDNVALDGQGHLVITAQKETEPKHDCYYGKCMYTSGRVYPKPLWTYGRFEARLKPPTGQGLWSAFWMLGSNFLQVGWPKCGEIDIMLQNGSNSTIVNNGFSGLGDNGEGSMVTSNQLPSKKSFADDFHVFSIEWLPDSITWFVDNVTTSHLNSSRVYHHPFMIILNLAVGGDNIGNPGPDVQFPKQLLVDYVRVYSVDKLSKNVTLHSPTAATSFTMPNPSTAVCAQDIRRFTVLLISAMAILYTYQSQ